MSSKLIQRARLSTLAGLATICLTAAGGCGGSAQTPTGRSPAPPPQPSASAAGAPQPRAAAPPSGAAPASAAQSVVSECTAAAAGDPGELAVCLARHGAKLSGDPKTSRCIHAARDATAFKACLTAATK